MRELIQADARRGALLLAVLRAPERAHGLQLSEWDLLIRQARRANLLARLCAIFQQADMLDEIALQPRRHLQAALVLADKHHRDVLWELQCLSKALAPIDAPVVLLKGAAYTVQNLPAARGRLFADIDIMVPKVRLTGVEKALLSNGWFFADTDPYDQHYYRTWMHQIPPMMHFSRGTVVDVHHTIVPETARSTVAARELLSAIVAIQGSENLFALAPADMVLHSAVHLFNEGEFGNGLRDLVDLDALLRHFGKDVEFFDLLQERANALHLQRPLAYALEHLQRLLATPLPEGLIRSMAPHATGLATRFTSALLARVLQPSAGADDSAGTALATWMLYIRGHALRMPLRLLVPHLARKALRREKTPAQ